MPAQFQTINMVPAGIASYAGADSVKTLLDTPSGSGSGEVALPADKYLTAANDMRSIEHVDLYALGGGTIRCTYDGSVPTSAYGFPLDSFESWRNSNRSDLAVIKFFIPTGTTMHVRYYWGTL